MDDGELKLITKVLKGKTSNSQNIRYANFNEQK